MVVLLVLLDLLKVHLGVAAPIGPSPAPLDEHVTTVVGSWPPCWASWASSGTPKLLLGSLGPGRVSRAGNVSSILLCAELMVSALLLLQEQGTNINNNILTYIFVHY